MASEQTATAALEREVRTFLRQNLPQIQMHGGDASVLDLDPEDGTVRIRLAGACSGCGISPMTIQAIKTRLPAEIPEIDEVIAETGPIEPDEAGGDVGDGGTVGTGESGHEGGDHHGMGGHPAGGGISLDYEGEIPDWRKED